MKDERIVKALDDVDIDEQSKQRVLGSLLAERDRMLEQTTDEPKVTPLHGKDDSHHVHSTIKAIGIAACLLIVIGVAMFAVPRMNGFLHTGSSSTASLSEVSTSSTSDVAADNSALSSETSSSSTTSYVVAPSSTVTVDGVVYHEASNDEAVALGLSSPLVESLITGPVSTEQVTTPDGGLVSASIEDVSGIDHTQAIAVEPDGSSEWILFVTS